MAVGIRGNDSIRPLLILTRPRLPVRINVGEIILMMAVRNKIRINVIIIVGEIILVMAAGLVMLMLGGL